MATMSINHEKVYTESIITIELETEQDLTDATAVYIDVKYPDGHSPATARWTGEKFLTTRIKYTTSADDLDVVGKYYLQAIYPSVSPAGDIPGDTCMLNVIARFK